VAFGDQDITSDVGYDTASSDTVSRLTGMGCAHVCWGVIVRGVGPYN